MQSYLFRNLTLGLRALHGENEHKCRFATPSFSRNLRFWEELTSRNFASPLCPTYLPSLAHPLLKAFFGRSNRANRNRMVPIPRLHCHSGISLYRITEKRSKYLPHFVFLLLPVWEGFVDARFYLFFCSVAEQACYVLMMNFVCPFMTIKRRNLQTALHLHHHIII